MKPILIILSMCLGIISNINAQKFSVIQKDGQKIIVPSCSDSKVLISNLSIENGIKTTDAEHAINNPDEPFTIKETGFKVAYSQFGIWRNTQSEQSRIIYDSKNQTVKTLPLATFVSEETLAWETLYVWIITLVSTILYCRITGVGLITCNFLMATNIYSANRKKKLQRITQLIAIFTLIICITSTGISTIYSFLHGTEFGGNVIVPIIWCSACVFMGWTFYSNINVDINSIEVKLLLVIATTSAWFIGNHAWIPLIINTFILSTGLLLLYLKDRIEMYYLHKRIEATRSS